MVRQFSELPQPLAPRAFQLPEVERGELDNGIPVLLSQNSEVPLIFVKVVFEPGGWSETKQHVAKAAMTLIDNGSGDYNADAFAQKQRELAASVYASSKLDYSVAGVNTLKKNMDDSIGLLATMLQAPAFPNEDWEVEQQQLIQNIQSEQQQPISICANVFNCLLYGDQYCEPPKAQRLRRLVPKTLKMVQTEHCTCQQIAVAGATTLEKSSPYPAFWTMGHQGALPTSPKYDIPKKTLNIPVDKPGAHNPWFVSASLWLGHDDYLAQIGKRNDWRDVYRTGQYGLREEVAEFGARSWHYPACNQQVGIVIKHCH